jgi:hypothetical protein
MVKPIVIGGRCVRRDDKIVWQDKSRPQLDAPRNMNGRVIDDGGAIVIFRARG